MILPGYRVNEDLSAVYVNFGDYEGIHDAHTPDPECPMPENERLANYLMRFLAVCQQAGIELCQSQIDSEKIFVISNKNSLESLPGMFQSYFYNIWNNIYICAVNLFTVASKLDGIQASLSVDLRSEISLICDELVKLQVDFNAVKLQIDKLYVDELKVDVTDSGVGGIVEKLDECFIETDGSTKTPLMKEVAEEVKNLEMVEGVLEIGKDAYYLKSKIVRS